MSLPPQYPLEFVVGDTHRLQIRVDDPDPDSPDPENPIMVPRPLTGWSAAAQIRKAKSDTAVLATFEIENELGVDGFIYLYLTPAESRKTGVTTKAFWDLELTDPNGDVETILAGPVKPVPDVTRV